MCHKASTCSTGVTFKLIKLNHVIALEDITMPSIFTHYEKKPKCKAKQWKHQIT